MIYLQLFLSFLKIGLFSFGGGYAMIPLIQKEIGSHGWLSPAHFVDIIAISEMTPGPIAVNSATFVGYKAAGILGGLIATLGVILPSMVLTLLVSVFFYRFQRHPSVRMIFYGICPIVVGLIFSAAFIIGKTTFFYGENGAADVFVHGLLSAVDFKALAICVFSMVALIKYKLNPILIIVGCAVLGLLLY